MAGDQTYVNIQKMNVKDVFDDSYKSTLPAIMQKSVEKAVKASKKLTTDAPKEKGAKGFSLDGSLVSLGPDKAGKKLQGEFSVVISSWPGKSIQAMPSGKASIAIDDASNIDKGDVVALAQAVVDSAMDAATKYMEKNPP